MEFALGHMQMTPSDFWGMSPHEFSLARKGYLIKGKIELRDLLTSSWYSGAMSQADMKKNKLDKFLVGIDEWLMPDEAARRKEETFKRLEKLYGVQ